MNLDPTKISWAVFDIDGVLIDVQNSFYRAFHELIRLYAERYDIDYNREEVQQFIHQLKQFSQMNDDWDTGEAICIMYLNRRKNWFPPEKIQNLLMEGVSWTTIKTDLSGLPLDTDLIRYELMSIYGGSKCEDLFGFQPSSPTFRGTWKNEKPLISGHKIKNLPLHKLLYTGRDERELSYALKLLDMEEEDFALLLHTDSGYLKPDASPLVEWYQTYIESDEIGLFFGDTGSDLQTVLNFNRIVGEERLQFIAIGKMLEGKSLPYHFKTIEEALETIFF
jgi:hypothetical protein